MKKMMKKQMRYLFLVLFAFQLNPSTFGQVSCTSGATGNSPGENYVLVWADEFDVDGPICSANWFHQTQIPTPTGWFNNEEQHYTNRTDNSFVSGGFLNVVAKRENFTDQGLTTEYTSARLNSKYAFTYGRVDVRAKLPSGSGTWPAIWMLGQNINEPGGYWFDQFGSVNWPACGEIDIMEHFGNQNAVIHGSTHTPSSFGATINTGTITVPDFDSAFHEYSIIWDQNSIQFIVDSVTYYTYSPSTLNSSTWPFNAPQYLLLNLAMGGIGGTIDSTFTEAAMVIDYVRVYQKEFVAPTEPTVAAEEPTENPANVISLFSDSYVDVPVDTWRTVWSAANLEDVTIDGSAMKKYTNLNFVGVETVNNQVDASGMTHFHFDLWTPNATQFRVKLVDFGADSAFGGGDDSEHEITYDSPTQGQWISYDIPLSSFTGLNSTSNLAQLIFAASPADSTTAFIDNVYFYRELTAPETAAPTPTQDSANVISMFTEVYANVPVDTWRTDWSVSDFEDDTLAGSAVKKYSNLSFVGIETVTHQIDASSMSHFHFDLWTPDATVFRVKLVDFGADGAFGGGDDTEHEISYDAPNQGQWVSYDIPLSAFTSLASTSNIAQLIFSGNPSGAFTAYIDNVYFYFGEVTGPAPTAAAPSPTVPAANVISMFSEAYTDVPVDTWRTVWSAAALEDVVIDNSAMKKYTNLSFVGVETVISQIDASAMTHFHFDLWTPDATLFRVKLVDFGADGAFGGGDDTEHEISYDAPTQGEWISYDIPMSSFGGLASSQNIAQLIFSGNPAGLFTAFVDNVYFYTTADLEAPTRPTNLIATNITESGFEVSWDRSTDNVGVAGYSVYLDNVILGTTADTSFTFSALEALTPYQVAVEAFDSAGNKSRSEPLSVTTSKIPCSETLVDFTDFESGSGVWKLKRWRADRFKSRFFARSGKYAVKLRTRMKTETMDLSSFEDLNVSFNFMTWGMRKTNDRLILEISYDHGDTYEEVNSWRYRKDFRNFQRKQVSVDLEGPFTESMKLRLRQRSKSWSIVIIDDINISGCSVNGGGNLAARLAPESAVNSDPSFMEDITVYPNPVQDVLNVKGIDTDAQLELINAAGKTVIAATGKTQLDLSRLSGGIYFLKVMTGGTSTFMRIRKQ